MSSLYTTRTIALLVPPPLPLCFLAGPCAAAPARCAVFRVAPAAARRFIQPTHLGPSRAATAPLPTPTPCTCSSRVEARERSHNPQDQLHSPPPRHHHDQQRHQQPHRTQPNQTTPHHTTPHHSLASLRPNKPPRGAAWALRRCCAGARHHRRRRLAWLGLGAACHGTSGTREVWPSVRRPAHDQQRGRRGRRGRRGSGEGEGCGDAASTAPVTPSWVHTYPLIGVYMYTHAHSLLGNMLINDDALRNVRRLIRSLFISRRNGCPCPHSSRPARGGPRDYAPRKIRK